MRLLIFAVVWSVSAAAWAQNDHSTGTPVLPPQIPRNFQWEGRWIVSDLGVDVHFTWQGNDGNLQMIAGSDAEEIHFTNLIYNGFLYTLTYKWPGVVPPNCPECVCLGRLTLDELNLCLQSSRYVDTVMLMNNGTETRRQFAHHFRVAVVVPVAPPPNPFTFAVMEGDFFVDRNDSSKVWKLQHFGYQNVLDPALDEWMEIDRFSDTPGNVTLPLSCLFAPCKQGPAFPPGFFCK